MNGETIVIRLELTLAGASVRGSASDEHGTVRSFDGRLGLLAVIDDLLTGDARTDV